MVPVQELLRIPIRRPKLLAILLADDPKRIGVASLGAFNDRLWRMTGVPLRYFQEVAFWLFQHTAALELQDGGPRAGEEHVGWPHGHRTAKHHAQKPSMKHPTLLLAGALTPTEVSHAQCCSHPWSDDGPSDAADGVSASQAWFEQHFRLVKTSAQEETVAFLHIPNDVSVPSLGSSLATVRNWLRVRASSCGRTKLQHCSHAVDARMLATKAIWMRNEPEVATLSAQALESRVNWACWAITQGIIRPQDLRPPRDGHVRHVLPAVRSFLSQIPAPGDPRALAPFIGCEADVRSLAERTLELLHQVWHERTYACRLQSIIEPSM